jgi:hypothetical protein
MVLAQLLQPGSQAAQYAALLPSARLAALV